MHVLIVESNPGLGNIWKRHLERCGCSARLALSQDAAIAAMREQEVAVIVLDLVLEDGSAFAVADFASYRHPDTHIVFVTNTSFFSDGSIFRHIPNTRAFLGRETPPGDLAAMVQYYGGG